MARKSNPGVSSVYAMNRFLGKKRKVKKKGRTVPRKERVEPLSMNYGHPGAHTWPVVDKIEKEALRELREAGAQHAEAMPEVVEEINAPVVREPSLEERLRDIRVRKKTQRVERTNSVIRDGFIYLVVNPAHPGWVKVGQTSDYEARLSTYQTASPHADYQMVALRWVEDRVAGEKELLRWAGTSFTVQGEWVEAGVEDLEVRLPIIGV